MKTQLPAEQQPSGCQPIALGSHYYSTDEAPELEESGPHESVDVLPPEELERCFIFGYN